MPSFVTDVEEIRKRAAQKIEDGAVTNSYQGDVENTISILNEALATEIVCVLRYMHHYFMATGVHGTAVRDEFKEHADAEREHADEIAERIQQLGGKPDFNPASLLQRSASQYAEGKTLADMIKEDLIAERIVIEVYSKMIRHFADHDPTTRVLIEHILSEEEEHASDLSDLLFIVDPRSGETEGEDPGTHPLDMHHDEQSRQQRGGKSKANDSGAESDGQKGSHHRELDIPATPRRSGGEKQPQQPNLGGGKNREGVGNLVSGDKTVLESPGRGSPSVSSNRPGKANGKNRKKR
jgi:bacterioferritin